MKKWFLILLFVISIFSCRKDPYAYCPNPLKLNGWNMFVNCIKLQQQSSGFYFLNEQTGFIYGYYGMIKRTNDKGINWSDISTNSKSVINGMSFISSDTGFVSLKSMGDTSITSIALTTDGGKHWNEIETGLYGYLTQIHFFDAQNGIGLYSPWKFQPDYFIMTTTDGGHKWNNSGIKSKSNDDRNFNFQGSTGLIIDKDNILRKTTDRGNTWLAISTPPADYFYEVIPIDTLNFYLKVHADDSLKVFRTQDGGLSWTIPPHELRYLDFHFFSTVTDGFALVSHNGSSLSDTSQFSYFTTSNAGISWTKVGGGDIDLRNLKFLSDFIAYYIKGGIIYRLERE